MSDYTCGECRYYVRRPMDVMARCVKDGVCLRTGKVTDGKYEGHLCPCNSTCNVSNPKRATHWWPREESEGWRSFKDFPPTTRGPVVCRGSNGAVYFGKPCIMEDGTPTGEVWVPRSRGEYRTPVEWKEV